MQFFSSRNQFLPLTFLFICVSFSNASTDVIKKLKKCLESIGSNPTLIVVLRDTNSSRYDLINYQWNTVRPDIYPLAYIVPESTKDVQNAVRCGKAINVRIFPKSGGHSYEKYSFGNSHSVVLDLRNLSEIKVNKRDKTAEVGSGALLSEVLYTLWTNGMYGIPSASCVSVGIGGVSLGGGYGFWSKTYGLTTDNILELDFVDPKGNHLTVNSKNHPDLYWALRGGGAGNFGIVTKYKFKIFDASALRVKQISFVFDVNLFEQVFDAFQSLNYEHWHGTAYIGMSVYQTDIKLKFIDTDLSDDDVQKIIDRFPEPKIPVSIKSMNFMELTLDNSSPTLTDDLRTVTRTSNPKKSFSAKSYFSSKILSRKQIRYLKSSLDSVPLGIFAQFGSIGGAVNRIPKNATSFVHRDSLYLLQVGTTPPDQQPEIGLQQQEWLKQFKIIAAVLDNGESYQNYLDRELKDNYMQRYFGENAKRLIEIKKRTDPDDYFAYNLSIPLSSSNDFC